MSEKRASRSRRQRTPFEWALLAVSLAATLAVVLGLVVSEVAGPGGEADLRVTVAEAGPPASGGRPFEVTVENVGGTSAVNVIVEVSLGDVIREVNLDLVAKGDSESAAIVVPADVTDEPRDEVVSYTSP